MIDGCEVWLKLKKGDDQILNGQNRKWVGIGLLHLAQAISISCNRLIQLIYELSIVPATDKINILTYQEP